MNSEAGSDLDFHPLLNAAVEGEPEATEALFRRLYPRVERMVHHDLARDLRHSRPWLATRFSTGDIVQDVFRSLLRDLSAFAGSSEKALCGYLAQIVRNRLVDAIRYHEAVQRDGRRTGPLAAAAEARSLGNGPSTDASLAEEVDAFAAAIATLPDRDRLLLRGRLEHGTGFEDLAAQLGYSSKWAARRAFYSAQADLVVRLRMHLPERP